MQPHEMRQMSFGALVKYLRKASGMTQLDLAAKMAGSVGYISEIERGEVPSRAIAERLIAALDPLEDERAVAWAAYDRVVATRAASEAATNLSVLGPLVARERELGRLSAAIQAALGGRGHMVVLAGEAGIGKTRLALEALERARGAGMLIATGHCYEQQQEAAFAPFMDLLAQLQRAMPDDLRREIASRWPLIVPLLPEGMVAGPSLAHSSPGSDDTQRVYRQITDLVHTLSSRQPVALLLDDIQWMDQASLDLMQHLTRHIGNARVLLLATYRDTEVQRQQAMRRVLHPLFKQQLAERLTIEPLTDIQTTDLLNAYLPSGTIAPEISDLIYESAGGVPYVSVEFLRGLRERGSLALDNNNNTWRRVGAGKVELPDDILDEMREHVERLRPLTQAVLRDASILGEAFQAGTVRLMGPHALSEVEAALGEAVAAGLVLDRGGEGYRFRHALVKEAILAEHWATRRDLHRRAAEALLQTPSRRGRAAELALHFREADDTIQALIYSLQAGDEAEALYAHDDAQFHYRMALDLARDLGGDGRQYEAVALEKLGELLVLIDCCEDAVPLAEQAGSLYRECGDLDGMVRATLLASRALIGITGNVQECWASLETLLVFLAAKSPGREKATRPPGQQFHSLTVTPGRPLPADVLAALAEHAVSHLSAASAARLELALSRSLNGLVRQPEMLTALDRAVPHILATGDQQLLASAYELRGKALSNLGRIEEGTWAYAEAIRQAEACGDLSCLALATVNLGMTYEVLGDFAKAEDFYQRVPSLADRLGSPGYKAGVLLNLGELSYFQGEWQRSEMYTVEALTLSQDHGTRNSEDELFLYLCAFARKCRVVGRELLDPGVFLDHLTSSSSIEHEVHARMVLAERDLLEHRPHHAHAYLGPLTGTSNVGCIFAWPMAMLAWTQLDIGEQRQAKETIRPIVARTATEKCSLYRVDVLRIWGMVALRGERWQEAEAALKEALALTAKMPYPYAEAKAHYVYGQLHRARGEPAKARERYTQSLAILARLGERLYAEHIERELAEIS